MPPNRKQIPLRDYAAHHGHLQKHGHHLRPNARTTTLKLEAVSNWWDEYCLSVLRQHGDEILQEAEPSHLKQFFQWLVDNNRRGPQQAVTLLQYFRVLKMRYVRLTGNLLDKSVVGDVNNYIVYYVEGKKKSSPRPKPVPSGHDFVKMLHYHYSKDQDRFSNERQRVQQGFRMIVHGSTGLRPSSTMPSSKLRQAQKHSASHKDGGIESGTTLNDCNGAGEAAIQDPDDLRLRYGDIHLQVFSTERGIRYKASPTIRHFKGQTCRAQRKQFTWLDQDDILTCPIAHLVALALQDKAFAASSIRSAKDFFASGKSWFSLWLCHRAAKVNGANGAQLLPRCQRILDWKVHTTPCYAQTMSHTC